MLLLKSLPPLLLLKSLPPLLLLKSLPPLLLLKSLPPLLLVAGLANGQALVGQKCHASQYPAVRVHNRELLGKWYLYARYTDLNESHSKCSAMQFSKAAYGVGNIRVTSYSGKKMETMWTLERHEKSHEGRFKTNPFGSKDYNREFPTYDVTVLHIDHRIAIIWYCVYKDSESQIYHWQLLHVLTKVRLPSSGLQNHIDGLLNPALKKDKIKKVDHSNCTGSSPHVILRT